MSHDPTRYFAFVRRGPDGHYDAVLPDFPDCAVQADDLETLVARLRECLRAQLAAREHAWPRPPRLSGLPVRIDGREGYWLQVDVGTPMRIG